MKMFQFACKQPHFKKNPRFVRVWGDEDDNCCVKHAKTDSLLKMIYCQ